MIHVGVDAWNVPFDRRGIGRYIRSLLDAWAESFADRIRLSFVVPEWATWIVAERYLESVGRRYPVRSRRRSERFGLDVLWFPFNGPSWSGFHVPAVATLHDAMPFELPGFDDARRATFLAAAASCRHVVTDSAYSAQALARELHLPPSRFTAIPLGVAAPSAPVPVDLDIAAFGRYVLFVGETDRRKGIDTIVAALARLRAVRGDARPAAHGAGDVPALVVAGTIADPVPSDPAVCVHALGFVDDATLAALYRGCAAFAFPSRYEGFGLPVLEAMSYGAPVVASRSTSIPEAGGDAALYVDAEDADALARSLARILDDPACAADLRARGLERARAMTWSRTAEATLRVFERVAAA